LGLPFAFAHHFDTGGTLYALDLYRRQFQPGGRLEQPYAIVTAAVLTAESDEQAQWLAAPAQLVTYAIRTGRRIPLLPPHIAATHPDLEAARNMPSNRLVGDPAGVVAGLEELVRKTAADEIMVFPFTHGIDERIRSLELLTQAWQRGAGRPSGQ
jgi:alkanesulfonate monooxygenase SsuD/methylene tetrahydromethanopterin reductase-like flavin-dependent oxidoreductase (luciferase family)